MQGVSFTPQEPVLVLSRTESRRGETRVATEYFPIVLFYNAYLTDNVQVGSKPTINKNAIFSVQRKTDTFMKEEDFKSNENCTIYYCNMAE